MWLRRMASRRGHIDGGQRVLTQHELARHPRLVGDQARAGRTRCRRPRPGRSRSRWCRCRPPDRRPRRRRASGPRRSRPLRPAVVRAGRRRTPSRHRRSAPAPRTGPRCGRRIASCPPTRQRPVRRLVARPWPPAPRRRARVALRGHGRVEAGPVDLHPGITGQLLGQLDREAVGVVQGEGHVTSEHPVPGGERLLQPAQAQPAGCDRNRPPRVRARRG